jgi:hypothetical protein
MRKPINVYFGTKLEAAELALYLRAMQTRALSGALGSPLGI